MTRKENMSVIGITVKIYFIITIVAKSYGRHIVDKREACRTFPTYDIVCHGTCPRFDTSDWEKNKRDASCTHPKTYHCAYNKDGDPTEGCAEPIMCNKGKEPILYKEGNEYNLECQYCKDEGYLNSKDRKSDSFSECNEKRIYCNQKLGEKECLAIEGHERHYTQTKCTCNWHDYYIPDSMGVDNSCSLDIRCVRRPCSDDQEMLSDFTCHPKCDEGMERINYSIACVSRPKTSNFTETFTSTKQVETSTYSASSTLSTTNSSNKLEEKNEGRMSAADIISLTLCVGGVVAVFAVVAVIVWIVRRKRKKGHSNSPGESNQNGESQFIRFCSGIHCCNCSHTVIRFCSGIHCCNCSHTGHSNSPGESNQNGESQYNSDGAGTNQSEQNETDNEDHTDNSEEAGTSQSMQNETGNENDTDMNEETCTIESRQGMEIDTEDNPERQPLLQDNGIGNASGNDRQGKRQRKILKDTLNGTGIDFREVGRMALNSNTSCLKGQMDVKSLQDKLADKNLFNTNDLQDLKELSTSSKKREFIFNKLVDKYVLKEEDHYHPFKECLDEIGQGHLVDMLEKSEAVHIATLMERKAEANHDSESETEPEASEQV